MEYKAFQTERLLIKPTSLEDAEFLLTLLNTPSWLQFIGDRYVKTLEDAKGYIRNRILPQFQELGYSNYTIMRKEDGTKVGTVGLYDREGVEGIDIGFALLPEYEGKGYAQEAAFTTFELLRLSAITTKNNEKSKKLLERLGFQSIGLIDLKNDGEALLLYHAKRKL